MVNPDDCNAKNFSAALKELCDAVPKAKLRGLITAIATVEGTGSRAFRLLAGIREWLAKEHGQTEGGFVDHINQLIGPPA